MSTVVDPNTEEHAVAIPEESSPGSAEPLSCPNCSAPADPGQLMCLECGSRLALDYQRPPTWRLPALIVGVVVLLAGLGVAIAIAAGGSSPAATTAAAAAGSTTQPAPSPAGDSPPTASQPTTTPATSSTATPAPATGGTPSTTTATPAPSTPATAAPTPTTGWPPGKSAFTVVLASMPSQSAAADKLTSARAAGIAGAAILRSDDFPTLKPGYWVVFDGQFDSMAQAQTQAASDRGKGEFTDAYPRFVSKDPNAKP